LWSGDRPRRTGSPAGGNSGVDSGGWNIPSWARLISHRMSSTPATPAPLTPGARHVITVADIAFGGEGVGRIDDFVVFVPFVLVGEEVEIELADVRKNFARARLVEVRKSSPSRVEPRCRYFGDCGGCQYQHMDYAEQLRMKHRQVAELMHRLGKFPREVVAPVVPCPQPYGYRNRIMIRSQWNKPEQRLSIGFIRHDNRLVVDIHECAIAEPALNAQIRGVWASPPPKGGLKVVLRVQPEGWELPRDSFFQNNFHLLPGLVEVVRERLRDAGTRFLVDVYCGVGFFALELADAVEAFVGIELDRMAIQAARENARRRGAANGEFVAGRAEEILPELMARQDADRSTVILDPPRTGCARTALETLRSARPAQIIYVSCHPATLARDLNALVADGVYRLERLVPLDMFPQTQHVECVADLRRVAATPPDQPCLEPPV
jgi:tRNA/tmRNA/rRNA uracil-C5-methylase (TrmA/RlmC/RlmD family)